ncbi:MAG: pyruvate, phosphate dikinase [Clostridia bacterium]|nr:pyruvate, phosphate dikinase [Clostridia bacterium]
MAKYVYSFNEGSKDMRELLGGKGANLAEMTKIGLPVPFGFTITTEACNKYYEEGQKIDEALVDEIYEKLAELEEVMGKKFGDTEDPLLVSVRSGAPISMPGMMDTILNLGLNDEAVLGLAKLTNNPRFAYDSYRRFIQMYGDVVLEIPKTKFDEIFDTQKKKANVRFDFLLSPEDLQIIIAGYKELIKNELGFEFPQDPKEQMMGAVMAVFRSWNNERAILYRKLNDIPGELGTAVNIQAMVFGNMGETSGTGVAFSRNPSNGKNRLFGEFLVNAQGEDVVAGIRTPVEIAEMANVFPEQYAQFEKIAKVLEEHYRDMQDMEFTVERGKLFMLQTRNAKRTALAAVKTAVDMVEEGLITKEEAVMRLEPAQVENLLHPMFDEDKLKEATLLAKGLAASPGAACGQIYFNASDAEKAAAEGQKVILVRLETSPEDLAGMVAAEGILTARGGMTSHAAVVARGMGKPCVSGCSELTVREEGRELIIKNRIYREGDFLSIDGTEGTVYEGKIATVQAGMSGNFGTLMTWADEIRKLGVRANADNPRDAKQAFEFGAQGIGLCRTEHMFFDEERIPHFRKMILADTEEERREALKEILPYQKEDFVGIYQVMKELPVTIRLLDPPLHEFIPNTDEELMALSREINIPFEKLKKKALSLHEFNPMLGHRGCRLAITYPEIAEMQAEAIITAAIEVSKSEGIEIVPEIMIPLVGNVKELQYVKDVVDGKAKELIKAAGVNMKYLLGTMIEIPRAALTADEIAEVAEFFSFGTNDLTQMGLGFSRDDTGKIINEYLAKGIFEEDPFQSLDQTGIGKLVEIAVKLGKEKRPGIKLGICGEHGGDPKTIDFCHRTGLTYVSCSPFRVPIARLAAAQAAIKEGK